MSTATDPKSPANNASHAMNYDVTVIGAGLFISLGLITLKD